MSHSDWFGDTGDERRPDDGDGRGHGAGGAGGGDDAGRAGGHAAPGRPPAASVGRSPLAITAIVLGVLALLGSVLAGWFTDLWWFESVGFTRVFLTEWGVRIGLFLAGFLITALIVGASLLVAYRTRPMRIPMTPAEQTLEQYRQVVHPMRRLLLFGIPAIVGLLSGSAAAGAWQSYLLWRNGVDFGRTDPQFGLDVGFFVFTLPWLQFVVSFLTIVLVLALLAGAFGQYLYGGFQLPGRGPSTRAAFIHLGVLGALLAAARGASYWLDRYAISSSDNELITGFTYTGANAELPSKAILAAAALICAGLFLAAVWTRSWRLPIIGVGLLTVTAVLIGGIYPALIQSLKVKPSEKSLEVKYIGRNIAATRDAYGLADIETIPYSATTDVAAGQLRHDAETIPGIRLVDPNVVTKTFRQLEGLRPYYAFPDTLDVDRYTVDGKTQDSVVAVREINLAGVPAEQRNWVNDHTVYTHGYGFVGAYGARRTSEGDPIFFSGGFGDNSAVGKYEPRVYFGEVSPEYSIVGAPKGGEAREFDYPDDKGAGGQRSNTYAGVGGVPVGSFLHKLAYAVKYREVKLLLSDAVTPASRILDHRLPKERVERVAPWLTLDGNVYPAVVDGRIQWIVDGYTMSRSYPNSQLSELGVATSDSVTESSRVISAGAGQVNYIRNSVKATVDAYDGTVRLYGWDTTDPILRAWSAAFPGTVRPLSEISAQLMSHLRYPQDLLKVQRQVLRKYHVTDPGSFYVGQDFWRVPKDPTHATQDQPTYYQSLAMPGQSAPSFSLTTTFIPDGTGREILRGFLGVDADPGDVAGKPSDGYGTLRLLELPRTSAVDGPGQVQNQIEVSTERSQSPTEPLNLSQFIGQNRQQGRELTFGNLLTLPVGGGLLYVQPMYVQASKEGGSFPQIKATAAVFGKKIAWGETLDQALDGLFGGNSGAAAGDGDTPITEPEPGTETPSSGAASDITELAKVIQEIQQANADGQAALKEGDFAAYGEAQKRLDAAVKRATELGAKVVKEAGVATPSPSPTASPSASPSP